VQPSNSASLPFASRRVLSVDVVRGLTIAAMILVNNPGDWSAVYSPLMHAYWTGFTLADLVFPAFVFIMGVSMPFAFARRIAASASTRDLYWRIARRAGLLIVLGLALNSLAALQTGTPLRLPGVLQRLALAYVLASVAVIHLDRRRWSAVIVAALLGHWALLTLVPFGGNPVGTMTPEANLARYVDSALLGRHALTIPIDPEGLLGTVPAAATALIGAVIGALIQRADGSTSVARAVGLYGVTLLGLGCAWSWMLPLSKPLWTGSFALTTTGLTAIGLALTMVVVDARGWQRWARPFQWLGVNPIVIYVFSEIAGRVVDGVEVQRGADTVTLKAWLFWEVIAPAVEPWSTASASLIFGIGYVAAWIAAAGLLHRLGIRIHL
jgi:predicted acyltransferase